MSEDMKTPTPWFVSGVRFKMNGSEWHGINRYDEAKKRDDNIACVGFDPRTGLGFADAHFIVRAVNAHDQLVAALKALADAARSAVDARRHPALTEALADADAALSSASPNKENTL